MADDDLFTLDTVRDFMMSKDGKVTNHTLVTHFRTFLNDSRLKVANRQKFKTFVNTLSTVKVDVSGEKVLVLKKKYRDITIPVEECADTPARSKPPGSAKKRKKDQSQAKAKDESKSDDVDGASSESAAVTVKPPSPEPEPQGATSMVAEEDTSSQVQETEPSEAVEVPSFEASLPQESSHEETASSIESSTVSSGSEALQESVTSQPECERKMPETIPEEIEVQKTEEGSAVEVPKEDDAGSVHEEQPRKGSVSSCDSRKGSVSSGSVSSEKVAEEKELLSPPASEPPEGFVTPDTKPVDEAKTEGEKNEPVGKVPMSVKDRAQHLNKMQSESDILNATVIGKPTRQSPDRRDDDDSQSGMAISLDATEREWMVTASKAEYHSLTKLLRENPHLAKRKDFTSGFTALHWAAKHGNADIVKLLCGNHDVIVNSRSHGGYTPLHLAAMHGHEQILEILIHTYGADTNIRDYSGKKAKQYLSISASTRAQQLLQERRSSHSRGQIHNTDVIVPLRRQGSYSSKIRNAGHFGISAGSAVRNSWAQSSIEEGSRSRSATPSPAPSPKMSPIQSPRLLRKGSLPVAVGDTDLMPPPKSAPARRKRSSRRENENVSDSELTRSSSEPELDLPTKAHSTEYQLNTLV